MDRVVSLIVAVCSSKRPTVTGYSTGWLSFFERFCSMCEHGKTFYEFSGMFFFFTVDQGSEDHRKVAGPQSADQFENFPRRIFNRHNILALTRVAAKGLHQQIDTLRDSEDATVFYGGLKHLLNLH